MKKAFQKALVAGTIMITFSCTKDSVATDSNCYECSTDVESIDVCIKEDGDFLVDGETVANPNNASLESYIAAIEANPNNDPALDGISCKKK